MRKFLLLLPLFLPGPLKRTWYRRVFGWKIGLRVRIGFTYLDAAEVVIGDNVSIGHFNVVRGIARLFIGRTSRVGNFNAFSANSAEWAGWPRTIELAERCYVTSHHFFDASGELRLGDGVIVAGRDTHFWTHTIRVREGKLDLVPETVIIGAGCYIGSRTTLLFCTLPEGALIGAGSVVSRSFEQVEGRLLIAGNPASVRKVYPVDDITSDRG